MIRWCPRRADDICPYGAGVVFAPVGEAISLPQTLPSARYFQERANGMIRWCIHSLSLGLWPIQLPRRGSLGYVLLFLALSYLYTKYGRFLNRPYFNTGMTRPNRRTQFAPYGSWSTFLPVENPQTFRWEQAPTLPVAVYLFARRDAPPGASGKGRLRHNVAGKGNRDDTPVHSLPQSRPLADPAPSEREPWGRTFSICAILSVQTHKKSPPFRGRGTRVLCRTAHALGLHCCVWL